jgi:hypothetical protein
MMTTTTSLTSQASSSVSAHLVEELTSTLTNLLMPVAILTMTLFAVSFVLKMILIGANTPTSTSSEKPKPLAPSKAIRKMLYEIDGEGMPSWVKKLGKYEGIEIQDAKVKKAIAKLEGVFQKEITQYNENFTAFKKLSRLDDDSLSELVENDDEHNIVSELAERLGKQKELILEMGQEILSLRVQEEVATRTLEAQELAKKMDKELSNQPETESVRETARSVEEQVLRDILASKEASNDMKERAKELLPHFKGKSKEEQHQEMKREDFEMDLQTLEKIVKGRVSLDEKDEIQ